VFLDCPGKMLKEMFFATPALWIWVHAACGVEVGFRKSILEFAIRCCFLRKFMRCFFWCRGVGDESLK
jgi:hypothetical protein